MQENLISNSQSPIANHWLLMRAYQIHITGIVQGVGFRPFVYNLALRMNLAGWVNNTSAGVDINIEGDEKKVKSFIEKLYISSILYRYNKYTK